MSGPCDVFSDSRHQTVDVNRFAQDFIDAGAERFGLYSQAPGNHHYRRIFSVIKRANQLRQLHPVGAADVVTHQHYVVTLSSAQSLDCASGVTQGSDLPIVVGEDDAKKTCHAFVAFDDKY